MRPGRIQLICTVLAKCGDGNPYAQLIEVDGSGIGCGAKPPW